MNIVQPSEDHSQRIARLQKEIKLNNITDREYFFHSGPSWISLSIF